MKVFGSYGTSRVGCFTKFNVDYTSTGGAILSLPESPDGGDFKIGGPSGMPPYVITNVTNSAEELAGFQRCFESRVFTYVFGSEVETVLVDMVVYLIGRYDVSAGSGTTLQDINAPSDAFRTLKELYYANRLSNSRQLCSLMFNGADKVLNNLLLVGFTSAVKSLEHNMYSAQLKFIQLPRPLDSPQEEGSAPEGAGYTAGLGDTAGFRGSTRDSSKSAGMWGPGGSGDLRSGMPGLGRGSLGMPGGTGKKIGPYADTNSGARFRTDSKGRSKARDTRQHLPAQGTRIGRPGWMNSRSGS